MKSDRREPAGQKVPLIIIATAVVLFGLIWASSVLIPLVFAMFFAALLNPLCNWLESRNIHRIFSAMISVLVGLLVVITLLIFFAYQIAGIVEDLEAIDENFEEMLTEVEGFLERKLDIRVNLDLENVTKMAAGWLGDEGGMVLQGMIGIFGFFAMFILVPVYTFLLLIYRFFFKDFLIQAFSNNDTEKTRKIVDNVQQVSQKYLAGRLRVIAILAVLNSIALLAIGLDHALFFAVFAALFDFVYFIGPMIGAILPITYALVMEDEIWIPIAVALSFYVIQMIEGNVLTPKIVGPSVSINPFITLFALFVGNLIWGVAGMILIIPALAILKIIFDEIDSMKPIGFVLGDTRAQEEPTWISQKLRSLIPARFRNNSGKK